MLKTIFFFILFLFFHSYGYATEAHQEKFNSYIETEEVFFDIPQNLLFFADLLEIDKSFLTDEELAKADKRYNDFFFGPWTKAKPYYTKAEFSKLGVLKAKGFNFAEPWTHEEWQVILDNRNIENYPTIKSPAIVIKSTNLRSMPTDLPLYMEGTDEPNFEFFDFFQYHHFALGTPLYVSHTSLDEKWYFVEHPLVSGWVLAQDVALVERDFIKKYKSNNYVSMVQDEVSLQDNFGKELAKVNIGALFPYTQSNQAEQENMTILIPLMENGLLTMKEIEVSKEKLAVKPLLPTPRNIASVGNSMLGQGYEWGGLNAGRDCSILLHDLFTPFGIWLHKNSKDQVETGRYTTINTLSVSAKKEVLHKEAQPFFSLISFPGHVGLYLGTYEGQAIMFHSILGLRTSDPEELFRHIIGKTCISDLEIGKNNPQIKLTETLLERARSFRNLP